MRGDLRLLRSLNRPTIIRRVERASGGIRSIELIFVRTNRPFARETPAGVSFAMSFFFFLSSFFFRHRGIHVFRTRVTRRSLLPFMYTLRDIGPDTQHVCGHTQRNNAPRNVSSPAALARFLIPNAFALVSAGKRERSIWYRARAKKKKRKRKISRRRILSLCIAQNKAKNY